jgi:hypothetical protein
MRVRKSLLLGVAVTALIAIPTPLAGAKPIESMRGFQGTDNFVGGSNATGTATATCAPGEELLGGGGAWDTSSPNTRNNLALTRSFPASFKTWTVTGRNWSGRGRSLHAFAWCGTPGPGSGFTSVFPMHSPENFIGNNATGSAQATCPAGYQKLGGGGYLEEEQRNNLAFNALLPEGVTGRNWSGSGTKVHAVSLCWKPGTAGGFRQVLPVTSRVRVSGGSYERRSVLCPDNSQLISGGGYWSDAQRNGLIITDSEPEHSGSPWLSSGFWTVTGANNSGSPAELTAVAWCAS